MSHNRSRVVLLTLLSLALTLVGPLARQAEAVVAVGQTATPGMRVDGVAVPTGTTLLSPSLVEAGDRGAVIHLSNGQVVALSEGASAVVEGAGNGSIQVEMQSGKMAYADMSGTVTTVASNSRVVLDPAGQVGEGERITAASPPPGQDERLCQLVQSTPSKFALCTDPDTKKEEGCDWEYLEVPPEEVSQYLEVDSVLACKDRNDLGLSCDCESDTGGVMWWVIGGLGGAAALGIILNDDDDETVASPTTP